MMFQVVAGLFLGGCQGIPHDCSSITLVLVLQWHKKQTNAQVFFFIPIGRKSDLTVVMQKLFTCPNIQPRHTDEEHKHTPFSFSHMYMFLLTPSLYVYGTLFPTLSPALIRHWCTSAAVNSALHPGLHTLHRISATKPHRKDHYNQWWTQKTSPAHPSLHTLASDVSVKTAFQFLITLSSFPAFLFVFYFECF